MSEGGYSDTVLLGLSVIGLLWYMALWSLGLLGCWSARRRYRLRPRSPIASNSSAPGVSILRPLKGLDANLYENLESAFTQEYPNYEIFFSVASEDDQALSVVRDLIAKYPDVKSTVIVGEEDVDINPKVNNLIRSYRQAANDILWVLDSNVMVHPGTLARSVDALTGPAPPGSTTCKRVGLVHHVPFALVKEAKLGSRIEEAFLNTNHAKMYIAINTMRLESCVVGKSNLYRRSDVERVNGNLKAIVAGDATPNQASIRGLHAFGRFLAEDNMLASALWHELGLRHEISCDVACNVVGNMTLSDYVWRRIRWIRVRKHMVLAATLLEPFTEAVVLSIISSISLKYLLDVPPWITLILHFTLWLLVDLDVYASLAGHPLPAALRWQFIAAWTAREILALPIYVLAILGNEVIWRGNRYQILRNGEVRRVISSRAGFWLWRYMRPNNMEQYEPLDI